MAPAPPLEDDAQVMTDTRLGELLAGQPEATRDEIISINTDARQLALQVALLVPTLAGVLGFVTALRMRRIPEPEPRPGVGVTLA